VEERLQAIADELRLVTAASRATVRGRRKENPVALLAESLADDVPSMSDGPEPATVVAAPTYVELARTRALVIQNDCRVEGPRPPASLIETYRVFAQMLAPICQGEEMVGTISVHQQDRPRVWSAADVASLEHAQRAVTAVLTIPQ
jgi:GAF domain-containing protein